jgi:hypothetical protein
MNTKHLTLIITVAAATTLGTINLKAVEPAVAPAAKTCHTTTVAVTTADANPLAPRSEVVASPKVFATFPYLADANKNQPAKPMSACACCKP